MARAASQVDPRLHVRAWLRTWSNDGAGTDTSVAIHDLAVLALDAVLGRTVGRALSAPHAAEPVVAILGVVRALAMPTRLDSRRSSSETPAGVSCCVTEAAAAQADNTRRLRCHGRHSITECQPIQRIEATKLMHQHLEKRRTAKATGTDDQLEFAS